MDINGTAQLTASITPPDATDTVVTWSTTNSSVATVDAQGLVRAVGTGSATITASVGGQAASCSVTVNSTGGGGGTGGGSEERRAYYSGKYPGKNIYVANDDGEALTGTDNNDVLVSGPGDDWLEGGEGNDIYVYEAGGGHDIISNISAGEDDQDELHFGPGISQEDLVFSRNDDDLEITVLIGDGSVTIEDWYKDDRNKLARIVFDDGSVLTREEIEYLVENPPVVFYCSGGNINISSRAGDIVIVYGSDVTDNIYCGKGNEIVIAGPGDDYIRDRTDYNGGGNNTFVYNRDGGHDTVDYYYGGHTPGDGIGKLKFGTGIAPEEIDVTIKGNNVTFSLTDGSGSVTFLNANSGNVFYCIDTITFADGTVWTWSEAATRKVMRGTEGDDTLNVVSRAGDTVAVYSLGGNDNIYGGKGNETYTGGPGNDYIRDRTDYNGGGNNTFIYNLGDGHDRIDYYNNGHKSGDGIGKLKFGAGISPSDVDMGISGNSAVFTLTDGSGSVTFLNANSGNVFYCIDEIEFADGTVWKWADALKGMIVRGTENDDVMNVASRAGDVLTIYGLGGNDKIYSGPGDDTFIGGPGNDYIRDRTDYNGGGNNTFVYNRGDGYDTVDYYYKGHVHGDGIGKLRFGPGISPDDVYMGINGNNVVFTLTDGSGSVTFTNANSNNVFYCVDTIEFNDGTVWRWTEGLKRMVIRGTENDDVMNVASRAGDVLTVYGLGGNDKIYSGPGDDTFIGGPGNDYIRDRTDYNGGGNNTFVYNRGDGYDTVDYYYKGHVHGDGIGKLRFGPGISPDDVYMGINGNNVVFTLTDGSGSVTFTNANSNNVFYCVDTIEFNDGTVWRWTEGLKRMVIRGTENDDVMNVASRAGDVLTVYGLGGNDKIYSGPGDDTFIGGPGNDYIRDRTDYNGGGNNTFVYNRGDGHDTVDYYYKGHVHGDGIGKLRFGPGISPSGVDMGIIGNNVIFTLTDGSGSVTFLNANSGNVFYCIDEIEFADGTVWKWADALKGMIVRGTENDDVMNVASRAGQVLTVYGLGGNDRIYSGPGDDTFIGGPGNDYIRDRTDYNGGGNNTFVYNRGDGHDTVDYYYKGHVHGDGIGKLRFGPEISPASVDMGIIGNNVVFTLIDGTGSVTFLNANSGNVFYCIDEIEFADETIWKWSEALKRMVVRGTVSDDVLNITSRSGDIVAVYGLGGNDRIYSGPGDDTFVGGPGDDYIRDRTDYNGGGNNTFVYNKGDGYDTVDYYYKGHVHGDGIGKLRFGPGISPASVDMGISGNNVVFTLIDGTGSITFLNANSGNVFYCIDEIAFTDGTIWKWADALKGMVVRGTDDNDVLNITSRVGDNVTVYGLGGDDRIYSGSGNDTFVGGPGDDYIRDRTDYNGGGNNTFVYNLGDGHDTVDYYYRGHVHGDGIGKLKFGKGIRSDDVTVSISGNNVVFSITGGSGSVKFLNAATSNTCYRPDTIEFNDGTSRKWNEMVH